MPDHTLIAQCMVDTFSFLRESLRFSNDLKLIFYFALDLLRLTHYVSSLAGIPTNPKALTGGSQGTHTSRAPKVNMNPLNYSLLFSSTLLTQTRLLRERGQLNPLPLEGHLDQEI